MKRHIIKNKAERLINNINAYQSQKEQHKSQMELYQPSKLLDSQRHSHSLT